MRRDFFINAPGLDELRREIRAADKRLGTSGQNALKETNFRVGLFIINRAQTRAAALGSMQRDAASSMKASRAAGSARILAGGTKFPFFGGAEFGAYRNILRQTEKRGQIIGWNQFRAWRGNKRAAGYFLYPTIRQSTPDIIKMYGDNLSHLLSDVFPD